MKQYDVIIIGSGPIAYCAALILGKNDVNVALMSNQKIHYSSPSRLFAIAHHSCQILQKIGIKMTNNNAQEISHIRVVDNDSRAKVDFNPQDIGLQNFGYMMNESVLLSLLHQQIVMSRVNVLEPIQDMKIQHKKFNAVLNEEIYAPLIIAADGKHSQMRKIMNVNVQEFDYDQAAIVIDIQHKSWPHHGVAVEKFTPSGPFAILPKHEDNGTHSSIVWVERGKLYQNDMHELNDEVLKSLILKKLDDYLGDIEVASKPMIYGLNLVQSERRYKDRVVFVGDAAQAIHPIAGQGFNLGLRDVESITERIVNARNIGLDVGSEELLKIYSKSRDVDVSKMICSTTVLTKLFSNDIFSLKISRRLGLKFFDKIPMLKRLAMKYACGI